MKATIKLYKTDGETDLGYPVKLIVTHNRKMTRKIIGHSKELDWNFDQEIPLASHPVFSELYADVLNIRAKSVGRVFGAMVDVVAAKSYLLGDGKIVSKKVDFFKFAEERIQFMKDQGRYGNAEAYSYGVIELKKYASVLFYDDIDAAFLEGFKIWKKSQTIEVREKIELPSGKVDYKVVSYKKIQNTTIRNYFRSIRAIYNSCSKLKNLVNKSPFDGIFSDLPVQKRRVKNVYLDAAGVAVLKSAKLPSLALQRAVDLSLVCFYLGGLDLVDVYYLKRKQFHKDRVYLQRTKLGEKAWEFDLKVFPAAREILEKYQDSNLKSEYLFPWRKDRTGYKTFRSNHNRDLRKAVVELGVEVQPKGDLISSKAMRHTFTTIAKFIGVDPDIRRELQGHERSDMGAVYEDKYPENVRDNAQLKVIESC